MLHVGILYVLFQRAARGGWKIHYHKTLPQKRFWIPPPVIRFPLRALSFPSEEMGTDQTNPTF